jgi:hypothetical protein
LPLLTVAIGGYRSGARRTTRRRAHGREVI